jgi:hypothetical protein
VGGEVQADQLEALLTARNPEDGTRLGRGFGDRSARAFDATCGPYSDDRTRDAVDAELFRAGGPAVTAGDRDGRQGPAGDRPVGEIPRPGLRLGAAGTAGHSGD